MMLFYSFCFLNDTSYKQSQPTVSKKMQIKTLIIPSIVQDIAYIKQDLKIAWN